ncbi:MAG: Uma2 family endonuclease [Lachnospiraceae bacterium]
MTIAEMQARKVELGYSNEMLSKLSGIPASTIQKVLGGFTRAPRRKTLLALEKVLGGDAADEGGETSLQHDSTGEGGETSLQHDSTGEGGEASLPQDSGDENPLTAAKTKPSRKRGRKQKIRSYEPDLGNLSEIEALRKSGRGEMIDGLLYALPAPTRQHQELVAKLLIQLAGHLYENKIPGNLLLSPFGVYLSGENGKDYFEPDLFYVHNPEKLTEKGCIGAPDWILEIASPATKFRDLTIKPYKYRAAGVQECWIIDLEAKVTVTYRFGDEEEMQIFRFEEPVLSRFFPGFTVKFTE